MPPNSYNKRSLQCKSVQKQIQPIFKVRNPEQENEILHLYRQVLNISISSLLALIYWLLLSADYPEKIIAT